MEKLNKKENIYIDLSKLSEEQQKHIFSLLPGSELDIDYEISVKYRFLHFDFYKWYVDRLGEILGKTELTYPEFIKLFEVEEGENEIDIEKMAKEALKFQHKNIQDRMIDFVLGFEEGFKKAMELNSKK